MLHPLFTVLIRKPELLVEHVSGYVALLQEELTSMGTGVAVKVAAWGVVLVMGCVFLVLSGVALMLGALHGFHWALLAVPGTVFLVMLIALFLARRPNTAKRFEDIKAQLDADVMALRIAGEQK
ncbi:hypothetical protein [Xylophilus ampelinus]|uniref:Uncharacterized protein n=1 Tax=Xylophilus ampelinus TaxID=54067 RepID=A0A318SEC4_9BURK|nr:hypothetical protein [Xylophilus ampelinus]MCS4511080.1 hypothetical protein [Xylophilus ampelinus]PYE75926.1 hypothetical protein DFQ15_11852 [Xylophilus ampelinus]